MECNGKCYLKKELAKSLKNETSSSNEKKNETTETALLYFVNLPVFVFKNTKKSISEINTVYQNLYFHLYTIFVFHPPLLNY